MIYFFHTFEPSRILVVFGGLTVYWYGFFYLVALVLGVGIVWWLSRRNPLSLPVEKGEKILSRILDLAVILVLAGIVGARIWYVVFIEPLYFIAHPLEAFAIWQGGLAFHGGPAGAVLALWFLTRKRRVGFLAMADLLAPALAVGQAIGRWGNYFNQELYGRMTHLPWGIPISAEERGMFFHPTFLYESLADLILGVSLIFFYRRGRGRAGMITASYLIGYSIIRFALEFFRIDPTPTWGLRLPQWISLAVIVGAAVCLGLRRIRRTDLRI